MADFSALKTSIQNYIKQNGNEEITGNLLQQILLSMVSTLGDSAINDLVTALNAEIANRGNADTELGGRITTLQGVVNGIVANVENGYVYAGIATPSTTPVSGKVFYLALTAGTYTNFGATVVPQGINILKYNGSAWSLDSFLGLDDAPTQGSNNLVKSGGVLDSIIKDGSAFDLSAYNSGATYADLSAALTALNALPAAYKKAGMSFKFVQSSDNKYVQARLMANEFTTDVTQWQGVDEEPIAGSKNLVESGGVYSVVSPLGGFTFKTKTAYDTTNHIDISNYNRAISSYIPIDKFSSIEFGEKTSIWVLMYDSSKNYLGITGLISPQEGIFTKEEISTANTAYIRIQFKVVNDSNQDIVLDDIYKIPFFIHRSGEATKLDIRNIKNSPNYFIGAECMIGKLDDNGEYVSDNKRVCTNFIRACDLKYVFFNNDSQAMLFSYDSSKNYIGRNDAWISNMLDAATYGKSGAEYFRLVLKIRKNNQDIVFTSPNDAAIFIVSTELIDYTINKTRFYNYDDNNIVGLKWEIGALDGGTGQDVTHAKILKSDYIAINDVFAIDYPYYIQSMIFFYNSSKEFIRHSNWSDVTEYISESLEANAKYIRIQLRYKDQRNLSSSYDIPFKLNTSIRNVEHDELYKNSVQITDAFQFTSDSASNSAYDKSRGLMATVSVSGDLSYGERHDILPLKIYPITQPTNVRTRIIGKVGENIIGTSVPFKGVQDVNIIYLGSRRWRVLFENAENTSDHNGWNYIDYDFDTDTFSNYGETKASYNSQLISLSAANRQSICQDYGWEGTDRGLSLITSSLFYDNGRIYGCWTGYDAPALLFYSEDNMQTIVPFALFPHDTAYEAAFVIESGTICLNARTPDGNKAGYSSDNGSTWNIVNRGGDNNRPRIYKYDNKVFWVCGMSDRKMIGVWVGATLSTAKLMFTFKVPCGITYPELFIIHDEMYLIFGTAQAHLDIDNGETNHYKDALRFLYMGNINRYI